MTKFDKHNKLSILGETLYRLEEELKSWEEQIANTKDARTIEVYSKVIERREREIEGVKKWMEEYKYERK
ncbi:hypothetical protein CHH59_12520 [Shouchella clausii]|uniref:hypothetical protein n=1 Tax=Shouchella clausii TaxID=79880 RepID=UPI000BA7AAF6|nr:hypothetical protein [Shouchella clausii]MBU8598459.1 hypothetical protein [Shouchella clausii]PAF13666.1 hypothetical protein CHH59_12520 [Shouchella clausii]